MSFAMKFILHKKAVAYPKGKVLNAKDNSTFTCVANRSIRAAAPTGLYGLMRSMQKSFKTVALIGKYKSPEIAVPLLELARFLRERDVEVLLDRLTASHIGDCPYPVLALEELG